MRTSRSLAFSISSFEVLADVRDSYGGMAIAESSTADAIAFRSSGVRLRLYALLKLKSLYQAYA